MQFKNFFFIFIVIISFLSASRFHKRQRFHNKYHKKFYQDKAPMCQDDAANKVVQQMRLHGVWTFYIIDPNAHPIETYETLPEDVKQCEHHSATFNNSNAEDEDDEKDCQEEDEEDTGEEEDEEDYGEEQEEKEEEEEEGDALDLLSAKLADDPDAQKLIEQIRAEQCKGEEEQEQEEEEEEETSDLCPQEEEEDDEESLESIDAEDVKEPEVSFTNPPSQKIELPLLCKLNEEGNLNDKQILAILQRAPYIVKYWLESAGEETADYNNLPCLDDEQFAKFYQLFLSDPANNDIQVDEEQDYTEEDAEEEKNYSTMFQIIMFDDEEREAISWLEFWLYMCRRGRRPQLHQFDHDEDLQQALMKELIWTKEQQQNAVQELPECPQCDRDKKRKLNLFRQAHKMHHHRKMFEGLFQKRLRRKFRLLFR